MIRKPTIDDLQSKLAMIASDISRDAVKEKENIQSKAAKANALGASSFRRQLLECADSYLDKATSLILGELRRTIATTSINKNEAREEAETILRNLVHSFQNTFKPSGNSSSPARIEMPDRTASMNERLSRHLQHFDAGLYTPAEPEPLAPITHHHNTVQADTIYGLQQGTSHSTMTVSVEIERRSAMRWVEEIKRELATIDQPSPELEEIRADLDTIKAQLDKKMPNRSILSAALESLKNIAEGVAVNLITPKTHDAIGALALALGVG